MIVDDMNLASVSLVFLILAYFACLAVWGYQDKKKFEVNMISILCFSIIYLIIFAWAFSLNYYLFIEYIGVGLLMSIVIYIIMRKQMTGLDHYVLLLGNLGMPYLTLPAFLLSMAFTAWRREDAHAYIWVFACSFIVVLVLAGIYGYLILK